jgi:uncharacterized RDD family membrane protein YckC
VDREPVRVRVAGFWRRAAAAALDGAILLATLGVLGALTVLAVGGRMPHLRAVGLDLIIEAALAGGPVAAGGLAAAAVIVFLYCFWFHGTSGQTPGARLLHVRVIDQYGRPPGLGRAAARAGAAFASAALLSLGFLWIAFDREKRGLHDWLAGTYVIRS